MSLLRRGRDVIGIGVAILVCTATPSLIAGQLQNSFVIDPARPWVYIELERIANRKPVAEREPTVGLWLRLKNNTRFPIEVLTFDPGTGDPEAGVMDEVVRENLVIGIESHPRGEEEKLTFERAGSPRGYFLDAGSPAVVGAGQSLLFSVPLNHVGPSWYLRVRFEFSLPRAKSGRQPYSFVDFTWADVPAKDRGAWKAIEHLKE